VVRLSLPGELQQQQQEQSLLQWGLRQRAAVGASTGPNARGGAASDAAAQLAALERKLCQLQHSCVKESRGVLGGAAQYLPQLGASARLLSKGGTGGLMGRLDLSQALATSKPA
jgi:hypothetical protein